GGANAAAIGIGDDWEVFQFASAELVSPGTYDLSMRLRGQAGTEAVMPSEWPAGARFVFIDGALQQTALLANERGLRRRYRVGPGALPVDDVRYLEEDREFAGIGLRPLAPAHLRADRLEGDIFVRWIRRTRIDGDSWQGYDVPLGEDREAYLVRVSALGVTLREATVTTQWWRYRAEEQLLDGAPSAVAFDVAQISDRFGPGPFRRLEVDG
ncbi:MAG: host specificity protein, partial [Pseudomonadota bacterium]